MTSLVFEMEREESGERFAGQCLAPPFDCGLEPETLAEWVRVQKMINSSHQVKVRDLACIDNHLFIVREYFPISLVDVLSRKRLIPLPLAFSIAHRVVEALGDLHLHMGRDEQIRNLFHLDLRPSRILMHNERFQVRLNNGGLWRVLEKCNPGGTRIHELPLPFLAYRAPEQFRTYLARRRPPVFTDIYLFGMLFYELLTGIPTFQALSYQEYEIQHCDQYPTPPRVWRPEIPEEVNDLIMKCIESDPLKRWRSITQVSLILEKFVSRSTYAERDALIVELLS